MRWLHIVSACIGFGSNVTQFFWLLAARGDPLARPRILALVKKIDDRLAVPAYVVTIGCGAIMWYWRWPVSSSWAWTSLALSLILAAMGTRYGPLMKRWIRRAQEQPSAGPAR